MKIIHPIILLLFVVACSPKAGEIRRIERDHLEIDTLKYLTETSDLILIVTVSDSDAGSADTLRKKFTQANIEQVIKGEVEENEVIEISNFPLEMAPESYLTILTFYDRSYLVFLRKASGGYAPTTDKSVIDVEDTGVQAIWNRTPGKTLEMKAKSLSEIINQIELELKST